MNVIICVDDRNGMLFNHRRQSRDKEVLKKCMEIVRDRRLWINDFSKTLFSGVDGMEVISDEDFLRKAGGEDFCFVEDADVVPYKEKIQRLYLFKWNRHYPSDFRLSLDYSHWKLIEVTEFPGKNNKKITLEVYER